MAGWTREYFERGYAQRWGLPAPSDEVRRQAGGLSNLLQLSPSRRVVDVGCGHGRHALVLAERGGSVTGVDASAALLHRARELAAALGLPVRWVRGDMRRLPMRSACADAAVMMDAFGFFDTAEDHHAALRETARVLVPGGRFVLKIVNGGLILDDFHPTERQERDGTVISVSNRLAMDPPCLIQRISVRGAHGEDEYERRQRLYRSEELCGALEHAGFAISDVLADAHGAAFDAAASSTIWIVAQRDARLFA